MSAETRVPTFPSFSSANIPRSVRVADRDALHAAAHDSRYAESLGAFLSRYVPGYVTCGLGKMENLSAAKMYRSAGYPSDFSRGLFRYHWRYRARQV